MELLSTLLMLHEQPERSAPIHAERQLALPSNNINDRFLKDRFKGRLMT
jgi:hypothetical protein